MRDEGLNLLGLLRREQRMMATTRRELKPLFSTAEALADAYALVAAECILRLPDATAPNVYRATAASLFIRSSRRTFILEFFTIARRHWPESLLQRRRAMELMAYAWKCWLDPGAAQLWVDSDTDWAAYQETFSTGRLRGALEELCKGMNEAHVRISGLVHPSVGSVAVSIPSHRVKAPQLLDVEFFDDRVLVASGYGRALSAERMLDSLSIHLALLDGFCRKAFRRHGWAVAEHRVRQDIVALKRRVSRDGVFYHNIISALDSFRAVELVKTKRPMAARGSRSRSATR